jgi:ABC-type branched-subunit amino acid transport system substrate-binding protein
VRRCLLALLVVPILVGCGRNVSTSVRGGVLTVYSASPLSGAKARTGRDLTLGEKLALGLRRGVVGDFQVRFVAQDSARGAASGFDPDVVTANAQDVLRDSSAITYLGDSVPGATRISLPVLSNGTVPVLSPTDPDPQLTAPPRVVGDAYTGGDRTGYSLAPLTNAQIWALAGRRFPAAFHRQFGGTPNIHAARGVVAMNTALDAVKAAGEGGGDRRQVSKALGPVVQRTIARART